MTFEQAQAEFQRVLRSISANSIPSELLKAQIALDALTDQLRGRDGFDSIRMAIDEVYGNLVGSISQGVLAQLQSRDELFTRASAKFAAIGREAQQNARALSLEKSKMVLPALNESLGEIKGMIAALKHNNTPDAVARGQSLLALIERVRDDVSQA